MSETGALPAGAAPHGATAPVSGSAGQMLRRAREAQGLPIDALAASIKVTVRKLELLEADRFDELPDATFTRALAQTLCRTLKLDSAPVLALLPSATGHRIEQVSEGLNAPFRDRSARLDGLALGPLLKAAAAPVLFLLIAGLLWNMPEGTLQSGLDTARGWWRSVETPSTVAEAPGQPAVEASGGAPAVEPVAGQPVVETVFAAPPIDPGASSGAAPPVAGVGPLQLRASSESWIEVKDGTDRVLLSRLLQPGETVSLDGAMPMRLKIGNAAVTEVRFRGQAIDIAPMTSENIARIELK